MSADADPRVVVVHRGSRDHFLAARAFFKHGCLAGLLTDVHAPSNSRMAGCLARSRLACLRRWGAASPADVPPALLFSVGLSGLLARAVSSFLGRAGYSYLGYQLSDSLFARAATRVRLPAHDAVFAYSYAALEFIEAEKQRGGFTVLNQIDPGPADQDLLRQEEARWPEYVRRPYRLPRGYVDRVKREWELADLIVVNSDWSRRQIVRAGADPAKIEVIPLAYEPKNGSPAPPAAGSLTPSPGAAAAGPLRVLWLGSINLRKGIQYLVEAARQLRGRPVQFLVAGAIGVPTRIVRSSPDNIRWIGPVPRSDVQRLYQQADVFVLPTLSDGFAMTQLEALANGVPVIVTPNCGQVVEDGRNGFLVPHGQVGALASKLEAFASDRSLCQRMSAACRATAARFSLAVYADHLLGTIESRLKATVNRL